MIVILDILVWANKPKKIVYIAHQIRGDQKGNVDRILDIIKHIRQTEPDVLPFAPYLSDALTLNDEDPTQRATAINNCFEIIRATKISECRLYGNKISPGMQAEKELFESLSVPVVSYIQEEEVKVVMSHATADTEEIKEANGDRRFYLVRR